MHKVRLSLVNTTSIEKKKNKDVISRLFLIAVLKFSFLSHRNPFQHSSFLKKKEII